MSTNHVAGCIPLKQFRRHQQELQQCWKDQAILPTENIYQEIYNHQFSLNIGFCCNTSTVTASQIQLMRENLRAKARDWWAQ